MPDKRPTKIFILEDSPLFRDRLKRFLNAHNWIAVIGEADRVPDALTALESAMADVLLLDLRLGAEDSGYSILPTVKQRFAGLKVIVLTGDASPAVRRLCHSGGADAVVDKLDTDVSLVGTVRRLTAAAETRMPGARP